MAKFKVNYEAVTKKLQSNKKLKQAVEKHVSSALEIKKNKALEELLSHPVTKELLGGPTASNSSGTLGGYGNLFSFMGFPAGSQPIAPLLALIRASIRLGKLRKSKSKRGRVSFRFNVNIPSQSEISNVTPMPWEGGSWTEGVENGISNFSYYMYKRFGEGRSGRGFQADHELRMAIFKPKQYVSEILNNFREDVRKNIGNTKVK